MNERILVVDDEPSIRQLCVEVLEQEGYRVFQTDRGEAACGLLTEQPFALIVTDLLLPDMDGLEVLRRARMADPTVTGVIITGYGTLENAIDALQVGARGFVLKPFAPDELARVVTQALAERRREQEDLLLRARLPILELGQTLAIEDDIRTLARRLLDVVARQIEVDRASLMLLDQATNELYIAAAIGLPEEIVQTTRVPVGQGIVGRVIQEETPLMLHERTRIEPSLRAMMHQPQVTSAVLVPLHAGEVAGQDAATASDRSLHLSLHTGQKVLGVLNVSRLADRPLFTSADLNLLTIMSRQIAIVLENVQLRVETERLYQQEREQHRRLQESQAQLIQNEKMAALGRLVASLAHEINNPLQAVQGCLTLARRDLSCGKPLETLQRHLEIADNEIERIATILRRMRDFYRPAREERVPTDLHAVLTDVLELAGKQLQENGVAVERTWAGDIPMIQATPDHLKQVFLNLVLNAIDAMRARGGMLRIHTRRDQVESIAAGAQPAVCVEFSDTGEGIPPEALPHIFEPFFTTKQNGTGLGLAICYRIIESHQGQIAVSSRPGAGTTFTIRLPVSQL